MRGLLSLPFHLSLLIVTHVHMRRPPSLSPVHPCARFLISCPVTLASTSSLIPGQTGCWKYARLRATLAVSHALSSIKEAAPATDTRRHTGTAVPVHGPESEAGRQGEEIGTQSWLKDFSNFP